MSTEARIGRACGIALVGVAAMVPAATAARYFPNCKSVNAVHTHGIAKNAHAAAHASGLTGRPFVNLKLYTANRGLDRDKDGVACEKVTEPSP
jgi:hypothetical protein